MLKHATEQDLKQISLFHELSQEELRHLARNLDERAYKKGDNIYGEGDAPGNLYIVVQGSVQIAKKTPAGHRQVLAVIGPNHFFGELSFFEKRRHEARARAQEATRIITLNRFSYDEMEKAHPLLVHKMLREIILAVSQRLDSMNDTFLQMVHYIFYGGKAGRVAMSDEEDQ